MADKKEEEKMNCFRCGNEAGKSDNYCIRCGSPLHNYCTDDGGTVSKGCKKENKPEAAFCVKCGQPTVFHQEGMVSPHPF